MMSEKKIAPMQQINWYVRKIANGFCYDRGSIARMML